MLDPSRPGFSLAGSSSSPVRSIDSDRLSRQRFPDLFDSGEAYEVFLCWDALAGVIRLIFGVYGAVRFGVREKLTTRAVKKYWAARRVVFETE